MWQYFMSLFWKPSSALMKALTRGVQRQLLARTGESRRRVQSGKAQLAFFLRRPGRCRESDCRRAFANAAEEHGFLPKLLSGMTIYEVR